MLKKRILLLGGSFNPIHETGHVELLRIVKEQLAKSGQGVDEAWLMPAAHNPMKPLEGMASFQHRLAMCQLQAKNINWLGVTDIEGTLPKPCYTHAVLVELQKRYPDYEFIWLMGSDNLLHFHEWEHWEDILQMMPVIVVGRDCSTQGIKQSQTVIDMAHALYQMDDSFVDLPNIRFCDVGHLSARATKIREHIIQGTPCDDLNADVRLYIDKYQLYR
tara:strand:- start:134187 stop:134840 length:654 start_codon:yes stop_codon:yes gene_type:complete